MNIYIQVSNKIFDFFKNSSTRLITFSFIALIIVGTILLMLPISASNNQSCGLLVSLFTATSATCVTGLVIVDTGTYWSVFGQIVILLLMQIGGLGIITLASFFVLITGSKFGLKEMLIAKESVNYFQFQSVGNLIIKIIKYSLFFELLGVIFLSIYFIPRYGIHGLYFSLFHSISAFTNGSFDIMGNYNSFYGFNDKPIIIYTLAFLIVAGGLGFSVWNNLYNFRRKRKLSFHTKVTLISSMVLIILGALLFFLFEYKNPGTIANFPFLEKINASTFHSITTRTSGFNSISIGDMRDSSKLITIILMFIGGGAGSTAGGIKVTTFIVALMAVWAILKGRENTLIGRRRISLNLVLRSFSIFLISALIIIFATLIISLKESFSFIDILYEVTSAFGTVGSSAIGTKNLSELSQLILVATMLVGRVGSLTFAVSLLLKDNQIKDKEVYPEGDVLIG